MNEKQLDEMLRIYSEAKEREARTHTMRDSALYFRRRNLTPRRSRMSATLAAAVCVLSALIVVSVVVVRQPKPADQPEIILLRTPLGAKKVVVEKGPSGQGHRSQSLINFTTEFKIKTL